MLATDMLCRGGIPCPVLDQPAHLRFVSEHEVLFFEIDMAKSTSKTMWPMCPELQAIKSMSNLTTRSIQMHAIPPAPGRQGEIGSQRAQSSPGLMLARSSFESLPSARTPCIH